MSKIQTCIIAMRLREILPRVISPEQAGFKKSRGITEHVLLGNEIVHCFKRTTQAIIKLDMAKRFIVLVGSFYNQLCNTLVFLIILLR